jgi:hypothetical protein
MSRAPKLLNPYSSWSSLFGATVRRLRLGMRAGRPLTQAELGKQIGYSDATVGAVERSTLRPDTAFMEGCERVLLADGMLRAMLPFVLAEMLLCSVNLASGRWGQLALHEAEQLAG